MRTFLSYDIDGPVRSKVQSLQQELAASGADLKPVNPAILHFTIRFLGEIDEPQKDKIISALEGKVRPLDIEVTFKGVGAFPNESRISVIWIGIDGNSATIIEESAREINSMLESLGSFHEDSHKEFNPHVTIARVRAGGNKRGLVDFIQLHKSEEFGKSRIGPLRLKLSELMPSGPKYSDIHIFK